MLPIIDYKLIIEEYNERLRNAKQARLVQVATAASKTKAKKQWSLNIRFNWNVIRETIIARSA